MRSTPSRYRSDPAQPVLPRLDSDLAARASTRRLMFVVAESPCTRHGARKGQPCWTIPSAARRGAVSVAVCGERIRLVFEPQPQRRSHG